MVQNTRAGGGRTTHPHRIETSPIKTYALTQAYCRGSPPIEIHTVLAEEHLTETASICEITYA